MPEKLQNNEKGGLYTVEVSSLDDCDPCDLHCCCLEWEED